MVRIGIIVEGYTEMDFIKAVLGPYLLPKNVHMIPRVIGRGVGHNGGGKVTAERLVNDMSEFYKQHGAVTSLVDFYGFKGKEDKDIAELETHLMEKIREKIGHRLHENKAVPYVQKHEFEALLFSDINAFSSVLAVSDESIKLLSAVVAGFDNPEEINDNYETAPSKRIMNIISAYHKRNHGPSVADRIGIDRIRSECPRFDKWVETLEALGSSN